MMMSRPLGAVLFVSLLTMMPSLGGTRSDPLASLCDPICWEEEALADQCVQDSCSALRVRSRAYSRCQNGCWEQMAPCRRMCNTRAMRVLERCDRACARNETSVDARGAMSTTTEQPSCRMDCFTHNMMLIKVRFMSSQRHRPRQNGKAGTAREHHA